MLSSAVQSITATESNSSTFKASLVCFTASLYFFYEFLQLNMFNAIDPSLIREFHLSATELGHLSAYYFYATIIFLFPAGMILDRVSTRKVILLCMFFSVLSTVIFAHTTAIWLAQLCRFITGVTSSFCLLSCIRLASRWFPPKQMALVIGLIVTIAMLGGMTAQTPLTMLTDNYGWRNALMVDAAAGAIMYLAIFMVVRDYPAGNQELIHSQRQSLATFGFWRSLKEATKNSQNWLAGFYTSLLNLPIFLLGALWGGLYLVEIHHLSRTESSYITSMIFIGTIIGSPVIGWFSDRITRRKAPMVICALLSLITVFFIIYLPQLTVTSGMFLFFLLGFFTSAQILSYPLIAESNAPELTGTASGLASTFIMAGGISQPLFGWLMELNWDHQMKNGVPFYSLSDFHLALWIMPIAFLIGLAVTIPLKETYCMRPRKTSGRLD